MSAAQENPIQQNPRIDSTVGLGAQFELFKSAFHPSGGLLCAQALLDHGRAQAGPCISLIRRRIASREILSLRSYSRLWIPAFQLCDLRLDVRLEVRNVIQELNSVLNDDELLHWFTEPNVWLGGATPINLVFGHPADVKGAARTDRYFLFT